MVYKGNMENITLTEANNSALLWLKFVNFITDGLYMAP